MSCFHFQEPPVLDLGKYTTIFIAYGAGIALAFGAFVSELLADSFKTIKARKSGTLNTFGMQPNA